MRKCSIENCEKQATAYGMCDAHRARKRRHGDPLAGRQSERPTTCSHNECNKVVFCRGMCSAHYSQWLRGRPGYVAPKKTREGAKKYYADNKKRINANSQKYRAKIVSERPWATALKTTAQRARERGIDYALDGIWAKSVWTGICALTGIAFSPNTGKSGPAPLSPTIDRIDSSRGYTPDNCRFILSCVNNFRGTMGDQDMIRVASALVMRAGRLLEVSERYTSQACSCCGSLSSKSRPRGIASLGIREWTCDDCGAEHDRDVNAAKNILRVGQHALAEGARA